MEDLRTGDLEIRIEPNATSEAICLTWQGKSNARNPGVVLGPYLNQLAAEASHQQRHIEMHFEKMEHFNSSTITELLKLIHTLKGRDIRLSLRYDPSLVWQRVSFDALRVLQDEQGLLDIQPTS